MAAVAATLDSINFEVEELDFEANGGIPIILSNISSPQVLDSYLQTSTGEKKLYKPAPSTTPIGWELNLVLSKAKISSLYDLIQMQMVATRAFRISNDSTLLGGFNFKILYKNLLVDQTKVWLSSFSLSSSFFKVNRLSMQSSEMVKCKLSVSEIE